MSTSTGREKLAALQAQQARAARQKKLLALTSGAVVVVLAIVAVFYFVGRSNADSDNKKAVSAASDAAYLKTVQHIPASTYDAVGAGSATTGPTAVNGGKPLTKNGKPEVLYIGAEFCPFCGMERWALTAALSRFGTFSGLTTAVSTQNDNPPNIPTMSYLKSKYTSKYLTFTSFETQDRDGNALQTPSKEAQALIAKYDQQGSIPFVDYGNYSTASGATFQGAQFMSNKSGNSVAAKLKDPKSTEAQGILGAANVIASQLCQLTKGEPASVCTSIGVARAGALRR
ncbi:MAG TPA: DUF929 family protein [Flexivirga sp.]|uniref:DUF929 family protein n=1 Tax=Flexivirga sp. TaxID=1962927 RepID=UPI002C9C3DCD|nr:DUF929 family protein [Flexivirga sp.]HWC23109.1 DUF929 family protein [Flexivirga sp.]